MSVSMRIATVAVGNLSPHDQGAGRAVPGLLRERALERPFSPGTALAECDLDPGRLTRLWDHTEPTAPLRAAHTRPSHPGRIHRLAPGARRPARPGQGARPARTRRNRRGGVRS
jgi:hydrogenase maturation protease